MEGDVPSRIRKALVGRYDVEHEIGSGGMATVYLATDLRHERPVALKVLRPELSAALGIERFSAEIRTTASLQHPHILPLLDSGDAGDLLYYVMPYVAGDSLADRLRREKQLPVQEALRIAKAMSGALDHAHRHGIVHRDVKPSNVLLHDGEPMVADFGIALAVSAAGGDRLTQTGLSLGTPHYMSPEQAAGEAVGPPSDVYALGCVLHEMLTGSPPFGAAGAPALVAKILTEPPPTVTKVRSSVPAHVEAVLLTALEKLPADRFQTPAALAAALDDRAFRHARQDVGEATSAAGTPWLASPLSRASLAASALLAAALAWTSLSSSTAPAPAPRALVTLAGHPGYGGLAISDDGRWLATRPRADGPIELRQLATGEVHDLLVEDDGRPVGFSPDGEWLLIGGENGLRRRPVAGGDEVQILDAVVDMSDWGEDGTIVYLGFDGMYVTDPSGAPPRRLTEEGFIGASRPHLLPGGRVALYTSTGGAANPVPEIRFVDLSTGEDGALLQEAFSAWYVRGRLLFARSNGTLYAVPFDARALEITGEAVPVLDSVVVADPPTALYAASSAGVLAALRGPSARTDQGTLTFVDSSGVEEPLPIRAIPPSVQRLSPDGRRIAYADPQTGVVVYDRSTGESTPIQREPGTMVLGPTWHPDGTSLAVAVIGSEDAAGRVCVYPVPGGEPEREITVPGHSFLLPLAWTPDGGRLVVQVADAQISDMDQATLSLGPSEELEVFAGADWGEALAALSPDGRWVAYHSWETGAPRVFVRPFDEVGSRLDVSGVDIEEQAQMSAPVWTSDGGTVLWHLADSIMASELTFEPELAVSSRRVVLTGRLGPGFDLAPDGRFLVLRLPESEAAPVGSRRTVLLFNWEEVLAQSR